MDYELIAKLFTAIAKTFIFFGLGALACKLKIFGESESEKLGRFTVDILFPFMVLSSITANFTRADLLSVWQLPLLGFGIMAFNALVGLGLKFGLRDRSPDRVATFLHLAAVNNYFFLPLIVIDSLFGGKAVAGLMLFNIGSTVGYWTIGIATLGGGSLKQTLKNICSTNMAAVVISLACVWFSWQLPAPIAEISGEIGGISVPLSLILAGSALYHSRRSLLSHPWDAVYSSVVRLLVIPALTIAVLKLIPLDLISAQVAMTVAVMPASCASVLIVQRYGGSIDFAGQSLLITTIASMATMPLFFAFFSLV